MNDVVLAANGIFPSQLKVMVMFNKKTKKWAINYESFDKYFMSHEKNLIFVAFFSLYTHDILDLFYFLLFFFF